jgi:energy-coupling factor transporter ATP-binding protein EcfA2
MKIKSLKISKFLSFGPLQVIEDFKTFNLFIGKNGSGKSNVLRILKGLPIDYHLVNGKITTQTQTHRGGNQIRSVNVFTPSMIMQGYGNREANSSDIKGLLEINYEVITNINQTTPEQRRIKFEDDADRIIRYEQGDVSDLPRSVSHIETPETEFEFYKDLSLFLGSNAKSNLPLLNFGLYYIFGLHYRFDEKGTFVQGKIYRGGTVEENTESLPSGVLNCSKILTRYFMAQGDVILIDEPELHLEPRMIRRLFHFLIWLIIRWKENKTQEELHIFSLVENARKENYHKNKDGTSFSIWAIPQGEVDGIQKYLDIQEKKQTYNRQKQLFVASHSSVLINEFLNL